MMQRIAAKPFWARVALFGLGLYLFLELLYVIGGLANGEPEVLIFVLISGLPAVLIAVFIIYFGSWAYIVGGLVSLLGLLFFVESLPVAVSNPDSFYDFAGAVLGMGGLVLTLIGCVTTFIQLRRGSASATGSLTAVTLIKGVVAVMLVLSAMSALLTVLSIDKVSAADKEGAVFLTANKTKWSTDSIEASGPRKLVAKNSDPLIHTFTVEELDLEYTLKPGSEKLITFEGVAAGSYEFICSISGHESMKGTLTVR